MGRYTRQATKAAKARLSGAIPSNSPKNKKIAFGDDDDDDDAASGDEETQIRRKEIDEGKNVVEKAYSGISDNIDGDEGDDDDDDDAVEEVTGSAARESIQRLRDDERKVVKETTSKKKRRKKDDVAEDDVESENYDGSQSDDVNDEEDEEEGEEEIEFTDDFFKMVDSERADQLQKTKKERKHKKMLQKKMLGKHTTFVVEGDYKMVDAPHKMEQNIEVVALGGGGGSIEEFSTNVHSERQLLISATLGSAPSKAAVAFARGSMTCGTTKERSSDSRKRKSKDEQTWKRSRKLNTLGIGSRPGQAAALFVCKKK